MLEMSGVYTSYGYTQVLFGVSLEVERGAVVALLGRNGMGKTTLLRSIIGFTPPWEGMIAFRDKNITGLKPYKIARMGLALVPQGRQIFPSLSVRENMTMAARNGDKPGAWNLEKIYSLFPILKERSSIAGNLLSGGEQQMLSMGRALMTNPELLLMDEPSEGLAPMLVDEIGGIIQELHQRGLSVLLVEQNLKLALRVADYVYILSKGQVVHQSSSAQLKDNPDIIHKYLAVT
jgi:branched-chain amino acid transport system ATP-binding protein